MATFAQRANALRLQYEVVTGVIQPYPRSHIKFTALSMSLKLNILGMHDPYIENLRQILRQNLKDNTTFAQRARALRNENEHVTGLKPPYPR